MCRHLTLWNVSVWNATIEAKCTGRFLEKFWANRGGAAAPTALPPESTIAWSLALLFSSFKWDFRTYMYIHSWKKNTEDAVEDWNERMDISSDSMWSGNDGFELRLGSGFKTALLDLASRSVADLEGGGRAGSGPPLDDGLTPSLTVVLANAKFWSFYCKTWYSEYSKLLPPAAAFWQH